VNLSPAFVDYLRSVVGDEQIVSAPARLQHDSRDYYWFSPILKPLLDDKAAELIVRPQSVEQLVAVVVAAVAERVPITPQGAATGNYGQGIPMQGGVIINMRHLTRILELTRAAARVEAGVILKSIETAARAIGSELRFFPSTLMTATAGGFVAGGAGGIGSVTWGTLWDPGNVLALTVVTVEETPRILTITDPEEMQGVIHNCGLTCLIADVTFALAPAQPWQQYVVAYDNFESGLRFGESLAYDDATAKRLVTILEWPIPSFFRQLVRDNACPEGKAISLLHLTMDGAELAERLVPIGGRVTWHSPHSAYLNSGWQLSDFSWNHTTLWAIKSDPQITYLQDQFDPERVYAQLLQRRERYPDDILEHIEFMRFRGRMYPQGMSLVRFRSPQQLQGLLDFCEEIGIWLANPHTHYLDDDVRWNGQPILDARKRWDPHGLLNPGHLRSLEEK